MTTIQRYFYTVITNEQGDYYTHNFFIIGFFYHQAKTHDIKKLFISILEYKWIAKGKKCTMGINYTNYI